MKKIVLSLFLGGAIAGSAQVVAQTVPADLYPIVGAPVGTPYPASYTDIARDPSDLPSQPLPNNGTIVITAHEVNAFIAPKNLATSWAGDGTDMAFRYFAFGGGQTAITAPKVPAPFLRVTAGRTVNIILDNSVGSHRHAIDFHAIVGSKGGAAILAAEPGTSATITFVPKNPGLYIYHCVGNATPGGIARHMNNGMVGLILVEPKAQGGQFQNLTKNAKEFYVMEYDVFVDATQSPPGFDEAKMLTTMVPDHVVYNGRVGALIDHPLVAEVGKNAVIYHGAAGTHTPSFHIIGEIFDWAFNQGDILSKPLENIQTLIIPSAGAAVLVMDGDELVPTDLSNGLGPDLNVLVDHSSQHFRKGALGVMVVNP